MRRHGSQQTTTKNSKASSGPWSRTCLFLGTAALLILLGLAFTPLPNVLSEEFRATSQIEVAEGIVVLGGGMYSDGTLSSVSLRRVLTGVTLKRKGFAPVLVCLGEQPPEGGPSEAFLRARLARDLGIPADEILTEDGARTTRDEAQRIGLLLQPRGIRRILLVTDSHHMIRARLLFQRVGFEVFPAVADDIPSSVDSPEERLRLSRILTQEIVALAYYWLAGYLS